MKSFMVLLIFLSGKILSLSITPSPKKIIPRSINLIPRSNHLSPRARSLNPRSINSDPIRIISECMNDFSADFFRILANDQKCNLICSPLSIGLLLSITAYGAQNNTEEQMRTALKIPNDGNVEKSGFQSLIDALNSVKKVELHVASNIFITNEFNVKPNYIDSIRDTFKCELQRLDFTETNNASKAINDWSAEKTNNHINKIIQPDDIENAKLILVNAVYFKGKWQNKFDPLKSKVKPFYVNKNTVKDKLMMNKIARFYYVEIPEIDAKVIEIPYERSSEFPKDYVSMILVVPNDVEGLKNVGNKFKMTHLEQLRQENFGTKVDLSLPKFKIESTLDLKSPLEKMGMTDMFSDNANFNNIVDNSQLKVTKIIQKAFIQVDEEGSEAAAVSSVMLTTKSYVSPKKLIIDRPFMFIIAMTHNDTTNILFQGRVVDPKW